MWVLLCRQREGRTDGARSGGARAASPRRKALCAGGRPGGQGAGRCFPLLVYSAANRRLLMRAAGREGARREPSGSERDCAPPSPPPHSAPEGPALRSLVLRISWCPQIGLKSCYNWARGLARKREAVIEPPKWTGRGRIGEFHLDFLSLLHYFGRRGGVSQDPWPRAACSGLPLPTTSKNKTNKNKQTNKKTKQKPTLNQERTQSLPFPKCM